MTEITCPMCNGGTLARGDGRLEQSGDSHLPTVVWSCGRCGYARYEPAVGKRWRASHPAAGDTAPSGGSGPTAAAEPAKPAPAQPGRPRRAA
jgi:hypothetical protein